MIGWKEALHTLQGLAHFVGKQLSSEKELNTGELPRPLCFDPAKHPSIIRPLPAGSFRGRVLPSGPAWIRQFHSVILTKDHFFCSNIPRQPVAKRNSCSSSLFNKHLLSFLFFLSFLFSFPFSVCIFLILTLGFFLFSFSYGDSGTWCSPKLILGHFHFLASGSFLGLTFLLKIYNHFPQSLDHFPFIQSMTISSAFSAHNSAMRHTMIKTDLPPMPSLTTVSISPPSKRLPGTRSSVDHLNA